MKIIFEPSSIPDSRGGFESVVYMEDVIIWRKDHAFDTPEAAEEYALAHLIDRMAYLLK